MTAKEHRYGARKGCVCAFGAIAHQALAGGVFLAQGRALRKDAPVAADQQRRQRREVIGVVVGLAGMGPHGDRALALGPLGRTQNHGVALYLLNLPSRGLRQAIVPAHRLIALPGVIVSRPRLHHGRVLGINSHDLFHQENPPTDGPLLRIRGLGQAAAEAAPIGELVPSRCPGDTFLDGSHEPGCLVGQGVAPDAAQHVELGQEWSIGEDGAPVRGAARRAAAAVGRSSACAAEIGIDLDGGAGRRRVCQEIGHRLLAEK